MNELKKKCSTVHVSQLDHWSYGLIGIDFIFSTIGIFFGIIMAKSPPPTSDQGQGITLALS